MNDALDEGLSPEEKLPAAEESAEDVGQATADDLAHLREELAAANDRALRTLAELENYRKRVRRDQEEERRYANAGLLRDLLPVLDNIQRTVDAAEKANADPGIVEGFRMVLQQLEGVLARNQAVKIAALGEPFDPHVHEAISQLPAPGGEPSGTVINVTSEGYKLHDRVLRPAQVVVAK